VHSHALAERKMIERCIQGSSAVAEEINRLGILRPQEECFDTLTPLLGIRILTGLTRVFCPDDSSLFRTMSVLASMRYFDTVVVLQLRATKPEESIALS
jgi:hypothetical protein